MSSKKGSPTCQNWQFTRSTVDIQQKKNQKNNFAVPLNNINKGYMYMQHRHETKPAIQPLNISAGYPSFLDCLPNKHVKSTRTV